MVHRSVCLLLPGIFVLAGTFAAQEPASSKPDLDKSARQFVDLLVAQKFDEAVATFDATMKRAMPALKLRIIWNGLALTTGEFQQQGRVLQERAGPYDIVLVKCDFERKSLDTKVVFDKEAKIAGLFFTPAREAYQAPSYGDRAKFRELEVTIGSEPWELPATWAVPNSEGTFPAVILVHGSGPNDRDETVGGAKPFKDLAWGLASRGIAVLRYEKRTRAHQAKMAAMPGLTVREETIDDAIEAAKWVRSQANVDEDRVVVIGHSLGGYLAPRIATQDDDGLIAGYVLMAGNSRSLGELMLQQIPYLLGLDGSLSDTDTQKIETLKAQVAKIESTGEAEVAATTRILGATMAYWNDLRDYDPVGMAAKLKRPLFILQGERDYQVTLKEDFSRWQDGLKDRENVTFKSYPPLNHLFMEGEGPSTPAEYDHGGNVSEVVVDDIAKWINDLNR